MESREGGIERNERKEGKGGVGKERGRGMIEERGGVEKERNKGK